MVCHAGTRNGDPTVRQDDDYVISIVSVRCSDEGQLRNGMAGIMIPVRRMAPSAVFEDRISMSTKKISVEIERFDAKSGTRLQGLRVSTLLRSRRGGNPTTVESQSTARNSTTTAVH